MKVDIKQQVAQGRGEVIVGDREHFPPQDQVKPCEVGMRLACSLLRRQAFHTYSLMQKPCRKWPLGSQRKWENHIKMNCREICCEAGMQMRLAEDCIQW